MKKYNFTLFADYFQFYIQDELVEGDLSNSWNDEAVKYFIAFAPGKIGVGTVRNTNVPVELEILEEIPNYNEGEFEIINECSIEINSGKLVIAGCTDYFPDAKRIKLERGIYGVRVYYSNLNKISENGLDGEDSYKLSLWKVKDLIPFKNIKIDFFRRHTTS